MKQDGEIRWLLEERRKGTSQKLAAARTGMSERSARKYESAGARAAMSICAGFSRNPQVADD